eukprot:scaffold131127_cov72-Phaeocystis_antarctica.AAC.2
MRTDGHEAVSLAASGSPKLGSAQSATETRSSRPPRPGPHERRAATCDSRGRSSAGPRVTGLATEPRWPGLSTRRGSGGGRTAREQQRAARRGAAVPIALLLGAGGYQGPEGCCSALLVVLGVVVVVGRLPGWPRRSS